MVFAVQAFEVSRQQDISSNFGILIETIMPLCASGISLTLERSELCAPMALIGDVVHFYSG